MPRSIAIAVVFSISLAARATGQGALLSRADSTLVGRIVLAEDRRDSTDRALAEGLNHRDPRLQLLARRAIGRIRDPRDAARDSLPAFAAPRKWPEPAWLLRFRALSSHRQDCAALRGALADSAWPVRLRAADLADSSCARDTALVATLRTWIDSMPGDVSARPRGGVSWHAAAHAIVALARLRADDAGLRAGKLSMHRQWQLRMYAARALGLVRDSTRLRTLVRDPDDNVKEAAILALRPITGHADDTLFIGALQSSGAQAVRAAAGALEGSPLPEAHAAANAAFDRWVTRASAAARDTRLALLAAAGRPG